MPSNNRRAADRRRAWGRGPIILRLEPLEGRQLLAASPVARPDAVATAFDTLHKLDWGDSFHAVGTIQNQGNASITDSFQVAVYASPKMDISREVGAARRGDGPGRARGGASFQFDQSFSLPPTPLSGVTATQPVYISLRVDPMEGGRVGRDEQRGHRQGRGHLRRDDRPEAPANLVGTSLGIAPGSVTWGDTITVTAQVKNDAAGEAPATRARIVLTRGETDPRGPRRLHDRQHRHPRGGTLSVGQHRPDDPVAGQAPRLARRRVAIYPLDGPGRRLPDGPRLPAQGDARSRPRHGGRDDRPRRDTHDRHDQHRGRDHDHDTTTTDTPATAITTTILPDLAVATVSVPADASTGDTTSWPPPGSRTSAGSTPRPSASGSISPG